MYCKLIRALTAGGAELMFTVHCYIALFIPLDCIAALLLHYPRHLPFYHLHTNSSSVGAQFCL